MCPLADHENVPGSITIVTPARNEERMLPALLESIRLQMKGVERPFQVIVADNGSTDGTAAIARGHGARVVGCDGSTVGAARNRAVSMADGEWLVFLDADMVLGDGWSDAMTAVLRQLDEQSDLIVGGSIAAPPEHSWVGRIWFPDRGTERQEARHVGSGHMVLRKSHFDSLGGFDPTLQASEDYDLCRRTLEGGGRVVEDNGLTAYHQGAPGSIGEFVRRELWHGGAGDLSDLLKQRVTLLAALWVIMHAGLLLGLVLHWLGLGGGSSTLSLLSGMGILSLMALSAWRHAGSDRIGSIPALFVLFYVYYWCRAGGLLRCLLSRRRSSIARSARS